MVSTIHASVLKVIQLQGRPPFHFFLQPLFHVESHQVLPGDDSLHGVPTVYHRQVPQAQGTENYVCPLERKLLLNGQCRLVYKHFLKNKFENKFHKCFDVQVYYDKLQNKFTLICQEELIMIEIEREFNVQ